jgi:hypothetical protein
VLDVIKEFVPLFCFLCSESDAWLSPFFHSHIAFVTVWPVLPASLVDMQVRTTGMPQYGYVTLFPRLFDVYDIHMNGIMPIQVNGAGKPKLESDNVRFFWYHGVFTLTLTSITSVIL